MRRLLGLVCAIVLVDTMLYAALVPLLPGYADEYELSKTGAGLLVAAYAAGVLLGGLPGGLAAARWGPKRAALVGLALVATASLGFALADDPWTLGGFRLVQGLGSALSWAGGLAWLVSRAPRARRGEMLGTAIGAAVFGALLGPVVGGAAATVGTLSTFVTVAALAAALAAWAARTAGAAAEPGGLGAVAIALRELRFAGGLWLMLLPALLFGVLAVLVPLELDGLGWGAAAIGAVFLGAAALEAVLNPLVGRLADRRGIVLPVRAALVASVAVSLALAFADRAALLIALVLAASLAYGALFTPAMTLLSAGAEGVGVSQGVAFGLMNAAWAAGNFAGPAAGGALGDAVGDAFAYVVAAGLCALTLAGLLRATATFGTPTRRVPEAS